MKIIISTDNMIRYNMYLMKIEGDKKEYYLDFHSNFRYFYVGSNHPEIVDLYLIPYLNALVNYHSQFSDMNQKHKATVAIHSSNGYGNIMNIPEKLKANFLDKVKKFVVQDVEERKKILMHSNIEIKFNLPNSGNKLGEFLEFYKSHKNENKTNIKPR